SRTAATSPPSVGPGRGSRCCDVVIANSGHGAGKSSHGPGESPARQDSARGNDPRGPVSSRKGGSPTGAPMPFRRIRPLILASLAACSSSGAPTPPPPPPPAPTVASVTVSPTTGSVVEGSTVSLTAAARDA